MLASPGVPSTALRRFGSAPARALSPAGWPRPLHSGRSHPSSQDPAVHYQRGEDEVVVLRHHAHGHGLRGSRVLAGLTGHSGSPSLARGGGVEGQARPV